MAAKLIELKNTRLSVIGGLRNAMSEMEAGAVSEPVKGVLITAASDGEIQAYAWGCNEMEAIGLLHLGLNAISRLDVEPS